MMDIADFLLARVADDEAVVRAALKHPAPSDADAVYVCWSRHDTGWVPGASGEWIEGSAVLACWDPARLLAECEAKRRVVDQYREAHGAVAESGHRDMLRLLALPYADHPDYREEWRP